MNLYQEILADILSREEICIEFPNLTNHASELDRNEKLSNFEAD